MFGPRFDGSHARTTGNLLGKWSAFKTVCLMRTSPPRLAMTSSGEGNEDGVNLSSTDSAMMFVEAIQCNFPVKSSID